MMKEVVSVDMKLLVCGRSSLHYWVLRGRGKRLLRNEWEMVLVWNRGREEGGVEHSGCLLI